METTKEKPTPKIQNLMTVDEFAVFKSVTSRTVYNWINEGIVQTHEMFGKTLVDKLSYKKP